MKDKDHEHPPPINPRRRDGEGSALDGTFGTQLGLLITYHVVWANVTMTYLNLSFFSLLFLPKAEILNTGEMSTVSKHPSLYVICRKKGMSEGDGPLGCVGGFWESLQEGQGHFSGEGPPVANSAVKAPRQPMNGWMVIKCWEYHPFPWARSRAHYSRLPSVLKSQLIVLLMMYDCVPREDAPGLSC